MAQTDIQTLIAIAKDPQRSEDERTSAIHDMANLPPEEAIPALIDLLDDDALSVRWAAALILRKFGRDMLIPLLRAIATRPASAPFYESAHRALVRFGDPEIEAILQPVLEELKRPPASSTAAVEALNALKKLQALA